MLLPASPFDEPESRRAQVQAAVERWDRSIMADAVVYACQLYGWNPRQTLLVMHNLFYWLKEQGYRYETLPPNTLLLFWGTLLDRPPLTLRPLKRDRTLYSWWLGLRRLMEILEWAGLEPRLLEFPPRPQYAHIRPYLSEEEFARLLRGAREHPDGRLRSLGVLVLYLIGEVGLWPKELLALRLEDYRGSLLRVRGSKAREVPLTPAAREALEGYLSDREAVAGQAPLPSPYLLIRMTNKKGGLGKPLSLDAVRTLLNRAAQMAQIHPERIMGGLRWRAARRYLREGLSPAQVARYTGLASVAELKENP